MRTVLRRIGASAAAVVALTACTSGTPASATATNWVANSCGVSQALHAYRNEPHPATGGLAVTFVPCGAGASNVHSVTAGRYPFMVNPEPRPDGTDPAPFCMQPGQGYTPGPNGAVLTPVVRCG